MPDSPPTDDLDAVPSPDVTSPDVTAPDIAEPPVLRVVRDPSPDDEDGVGAPGRPLLLTGEVVTDERLIVDGALVIDGARLAFVGERDEALAAWPQARTPQGWEQGRLLLPGLVDIHNHGGMGAEFGSPLTAAAGEAHGQPAMAAVEHHRRHGTTSMLASLVSNTPERLEGGVAAATRLVVDGELEGIHLEGPFLSTARCGAQNPAVLRDPDVALVERWVQAAADAGDEEAIVQLTYAPERAGGLAFAGELADFGIIASLGHTNATALVARQALERTLAAQGLADGAPLVTHVFNGMPPMHHRSPGPIAPALAAAARGEAVLEVIGDGVHLDPETIRMLLETVGPDNLALITDALPPAGLPDGPYSLGGLDVVVRGGEAHLASNDAIAGSTATLLDVVRFVVTHTGASIVEATRMASSTPARAIGLSGKGIGRLAEGHRADVLVADRSLRPVAVLRAGQWVDGVGEPGPQSTD